MSDPNAEIQHQPGYGQMTARLTHSEPLRLDVLGEFLSNLEGALRCCERDITGLKRAKLRYRIVRLAHDETATELTIEQFIPEKRSRR